MDNNIPAFPLFIDKDAFNEGMTLLDYFAAKALVGMTSRIPMSMMDINSDKNISKSCYKLAAALMEERKKYMP